jgi:hypothetical protein
MKNLFLFMAITLVGLGGCSEKRSQPLAIDNSLTQEEIAAGVLSPEVMWKMGRVGLASLSPDASRLLYTVTWYNMQENRGVTAIYVRDAASGEVAQLTDFSSNNSDPKWNADGSKIYFLSDRSGSSQIWEMTKSLPAFETRQGHRRVRRKSCGRQSLLCTGRTGRRPQVVRHPPGHGRIESPRLRRPDVPPLGPLG